jgi:hypothetical protein
MLRLNRMARPSSTPTLPLGLAAAKAATDEDSSNGQRSPSDPGTIGQPKRQAIVARVFAQARAIRAWPQRTFGVGAKSLGFDGMALG